jgi:hypothetical protein
MGGRSRSGKNVLAFLSPMCPHQDVASQPEKVHSSAKNARILPVRRVFIPLATSPVKECNS